MESAHIQYFRLRLRCLGGRHQQLESSSPALQTHPSGNSGKPLVSGCTGSGYFFCQSLGGVLPCSLNRASCLASQRARRSARMRWSSSEAFSPSPPAPLPPGERGDEAPPASGERGVDVAAESRVRGNVRAARALSPSPLVGEGLGRGGKGACTAR